MSHNHTDCALDLGAGSTRDMEVYGGRSDLFLSGVQKCTVCRSRCNCAVDDIYRHEVVRSLHRAAQAIHLRSILYDFKLNTSARRPRISSSMIMALAAVFPSTFLIWHAATTTG